MKQKSKEIEFSACKGRIMALCYPKMESGIMEKIDPMLAELRAELAAGKYPADAH